VETVSLSLSKILLWWGAFGSGDSPPVLEYTAIPDAPAFPDPVTITYAGTSTGNIFTATMGGKTDAILSGLWDRAVANGIVGSSGTPRRYRNLDVNTIIGNVSGAFPTDQCFKSLNSSTWVQIHGKSATEPFILAGNRNGVQWNALAAGAVVKAFNVVCKNLSFAGTLINTGTLANTYALVQLEFYRVFGLNTEGEGLYLGSTDKVNYSMFTQCIVRHIFITNKGRDGVQFNNHANLLAEYITVWDVGIEEVADQNQLIQLQNVNGIVQHSIFSGAPALGNIFSNGITIENCYFRWDAGYMYLGRLASAYTAPPTANNQPIIFRNCIFDPVNNVTDLFDVLEDGCAITLEDCIISTRVSNIFLDERVDKLTYALSETGTVWTAPGDIPQVTLQSVSAEDYDTHGLVTSTYHYNRGMGYRTPAA
jgi:hypothetical protein